MPTSGKPASGRPKKTRFPKPCIGYARRPETSVKPARIMSGTVMTGGDSGGRTRAREAPGDGLDHQPHAENAGRDAVPAPRAARRENPGRHRAASDGDGQ